MDAIQFSVLVEDTVHIPRMRAEHGLCLHIEFGGSRILFDAGASALYLGNAKQLGLRLHDLDALVLSHNHYDHTGGLEFLVDLYSKVPPIYGHAKVFQQSYRKTEKGKSEAIGFPYPLGLKDLQNRGVSVTMNREPCELRPQVWLSGEIPRDCPFEKVEPEFFLDSQLRQPDLLDDDQALVLSTGRGLVLVVGCCHSGLINTLERVGSLFPGQKVRAIVGGLHLLHAPMIRIRRTLEYLKILDLEMVVAGHCTGIAALCALRKAFGKRFRALAVGERFSLG